MTAKSYYPKSFFKLILLGLLLVMLPICFAFYSTARHLERLATRSQEAVYQAVKITTGCRKLSELATDIERSFQQYLILGKPESLAQFTETHRLFQATVVSLQGATNNTATGPNLERLQRVEAGLYDDVIKAESTPDALAGIAERFPQLNDLAMALYRDSDIHIHLEVDNMHAAALDAERSMVLQLGGLIPLAILLAIAFTVFITRPFEQINSAIRVMGKGNLSQAVQVSGPSDLVDLGRQLDWLRKRLLELEEGKKRFLQHVSHELKTPLAALREGSDLLADEVGGQLSDQQREITTILRNKSLQLQRMIENLLNFSAGDAARYNRSLLHVQAVSVRQLLASVFEDHRLVAQGKGLRLQLAGQDVIVQADAEKLRIVFDNVISNAIKFSPEAGLVRASATAEGPLALIQIDDEGPGIVPEDRERIFDPFYRTRTPQHGPVKGTGLGLAIMREFVLAHGGSVRVAENRPRGASFRINLPNSGPAATEANNQRGTA